MENKKQLIDAKALVLKFEELRREPSYPNSFDSWRSGLVLAIEAVDEAPAVDAVEVVRCKDCKWYQSYECRKPNALLDVKPEDFCSFGETK